LGRAGKGLILRWLPELSSFIPDFGSGCGKSARSGEAKIIKTFI
jgi:hypothetical protein